MRRTVLLAVLLLTGCGTAAETEQIPPARAAEPQHAELDWRESHPSTGERLHFAVDELTVRRGRLVGGDRRHERDAHLVRARGQPGRLSFGLMLFATGELEELEKANREGRMPAPSRLADTMKPEPPDVLAPGATWRATLSGRGSLADGSWVRVAFGPLRAVGEPPPGMRARASTGSPTAPTSSSAAGLW